MPDEVDSGLTEIRGKHGCFLSPTKEVTLWDFGLTPTLVLSTPTVSSP